MATSYLIGAVDSEIFERKLQLIEKKVKQLSLAAEAQKQGMTTGNYINQYINDKSRELFTEADEKAFLKDKVVPQGVDPKKWVTDELLKKRRKRSADYILEKYILDLPILVNLEPPQYDFDSQQEWTPHMGDENSQIKILVFSGTKSHSEKKLLRELKVIGEKYHNIWVGYRPVLGDGNPFQQMNILFQFCVWIEHPDQFWDFLVASSGNRSLETEKHLYSVAKKMKLSTGQLKQCLLDQSYKKVMEYHRDYSNYLGVSVGPVVFVGGEILHGAVSVEQIEKIIHRKLSIPSAGTW